MKTIRSRQQGMTLLVVLAMLVMITLFVVSMVRLSNTNAIIVGNMQAQKNIEAEAQQAIELGVNQFSFFDDTIRNQNAWASNATSVDYETLWSAYKPSGAGTVPPMQSAVTMYRPQCVHSEPATGYSALSNVSPQDTTWDLKVTAADSITGAVTEVHQGVKIRLPAGSC